MDDKVSMRLEVLAVALVGFIAVVLGMSLHALAADTPAPAPAAVKQAQPPGPAPQIEPPAPAFSTPPPPSAQPMEAHPQPPPPSPATAAGPRPPGQWTYTQQYGWLWMPYDQRYTQVVDDAALAYEYVWYPAFGWSWVVAPWVLGFGVTPYWGVAGPMHFAWYAHPWFRVGTAHLRPTWGVGIGARGGFGRHIGGAGHGRR